MRTKAALGVVCFFAIIFALTRCTKTTITPVTVDAAFFDSVFVDTPYHYYKGDSATYRLSSSSSGHLYKYFQVKYNNIAYAALTDSGRLPKGGSFPTNSVIIKQFYDSVLIKGTDTTLGPLLEYAIMKKAPGDTLSGSGWLWGEYLADGSVVVSIKDKGVSKVITTSNSTSNCISCHSGASNYDYNWVFSTYP